MAMEAISNKIQTIKKQWFALPRLQITGRYCAAFVLIEALLLLLLTRLPLDLNSETIEFATVFNMVFIVTGSVAIALLKKCKYIRSPLKRLASQVSVILVALLVPIIAAYIVVCNFIFSLILDSD